MNKAELVNEVHRLLGEGASRAAAERAAESVLCAIKRGLKRDAEVHLVGFGTFSVRQKGRRVGRNPKTGEEVPILPRRVLVFRPSHVLKSRINGAAEDEAADDT